MTKGFLNIVVADDESCWRGKYEEWLKSSDCLIHNMIANIYHTNDAIEALEKITTLDIHLCVADLFMKPHCQYPNHVGSKENPFGGAWLIRKIIENNLRVPVLLISNKAEARDWIKKWLSDEIYNSNYKFVNKPDNNSVATKDNLLNKTYATIKELLTPCYGNMLDPTGGPIIGDSTAIKDVLIIIDKIATSDANTLLIGESGTGKEKIARIIHFNSPRKHKSFIPVNCASLEDTTLFESELFGHEKGAFTGAITTKEGMFKEADKGTIFLDEIGELTPNRQAKLLRVLQEKTIRRVGSNREISIDVRIIAATNKDLKGEVKNGNFREDLFYRLNVLTIKIPPLRKRAEDIPLLAKYFIKEYSEKEKKAINTIDSEALSLLMEYPFPGNVRELENMIRRAIILCDGDTIQKEHLSFIWNQEEITATKVSSELIDLSKLTWPFGEGQFKKFINEIERQLCSIALSRSKGNKSFAAKLLGMPASTFKDKC